MKAGDQAVVKTTTWMRAVVENMITPSTINYQGVNESEPNCLRRRTVENTLTPITPNYAIHPK
jgi:hypothetical protein